MKKLSPQQTNLNTKTTDFWDEIEETFVKGDIRITHFKKLSKYMPKTNTDSSSGALF